MNLNSQIYYLKLVDDILNFYKQTNDAQNFQLFYPYNKN